MGQLNATRIFNAVKGLFSGLDSTDDDLLKYALGLRWKERVYITDGGTAGTAQTATAFWTNDLGTNVRLISAKLVTPVTATAHASNTATVTVAKVDATGANAATVAAYTSDIAGGTATAFVPKELTRTVGNVVVASGWTLHVAASKAATGVAIAAATSQAYVEVTLEKEQ